jgi:hypothetical protein
MLIVSTAGTSDTIQAILEHVPIILQSTAVSLRNHLLVTKPPRFTGTQRFHDFKHRPTQRSLTLDPEVIVRPQKEPVWMVGMTGFKDSPSLPQATLPLLDNLWLPLFGVNCWRAVRSRSMVTSHTNAPSTTRLRITQPRSRGSIPRRGKKSFSPLAPRSFQGPPSLLLKG